MSKEGGVVIQVDPVRCVSSSCCVLWFIATCAFAGVFGWSYSGWVSDVPFRPEEACRLTYTDSNVISESEMRNWAATEGWALEHPYYNSSLKSCVCSTPLSTPAWIAPGDLVSLYNGSLPMEFVSKYKNEYSQNDHIKVCIDQKRLISLWDSYHCHIENEGKLSIVLTGYDGDLFCGLCGTGYDNWNDFCSNGVSGVAALCKPVCILHAP